jgi:hypothetical protein
VNDVTGTILSGNIISYIKVLSLGWVRKIRSEDGLTQGQESKRALMKRNNQ